MSECSGPGCTYDGCSGRNADQVNAYARQTPATQMQAALVEREALTPAQRAELREALQRMASGSPATPNRASRRKAAREARRGR